MKMKQSLKNRLGKRLYKRSEVWDACRMKKTILLNYFFAVLCFCFVFQSCTSYNAEHDLNNPISDERSMNSSIETAIENDSKSVGDQQESTEAADDLFMFQLLSEILEQKYEAALEKESLLDEYCTTLGMISLYQKYTKVWETVADKYFNLIMDLRDDLYYDADELDVFYNSLERLKTNWEKYFDEQMDAYKLNQRARHGDGTIIGPSVAIYQYELQKDWAMQILAIYEDMAVHGKNYISKTGLDSIIANQSTIEDVSEFVYFQMVYPTANGAYLHLYSDDGKSVFIWFSDTDLMVTNIQVDP